MKLLQSLRQTIEEARSNPGFTLLYIGGVAFAVAFTMVFAIIYYVRLAPIYPEYNRDTTFYLKNIGVKNEKSHWYSISNIGMPFVEECLAKMKNYEYYTVKSSYQLGTFVQPTDGSGDFAVALKNIDPNFFKLYEYEFLAGHPFSDAEFDSGIDMVVITEDVANRLYGRAEAAVGKDISLNYVTKKIIGVVKSGSSIFTESFAQVFCTNKSGSDYSRTSVSNDPSRFLGSYFVAIKVKDNAQKEALKAEFDEMFRKINAADSIWNTSLVQFVTNTEMVFKKDGEEADLMANIKPYLTLLLVLLIIPAINISGMIGGQMERRMVEMGLRRSFGASKSSLCRQVMFENLILTIAGGLVGLIIAWIIIYLFKGSILGLIGNHWEYLGNFAEAEVTGEMLFAPAVFIGTLLVCVILNVMSAYIPVRYALRRPIVSSINVKK